MSGTKKAVLSTSNCTNTNTDCLIRWLTAKFPVAVTAYTVGKGSLK